MHEKVFNAAQMSQRDLYISLYYVHHVQIATRHTRIQTLIFLFGYFCSTIFRLLMNKIDFGRINLRSVSHETSRFLEMIYFCRCICVI